jgi:protein-S-isoprenylcysteine O-methyltransferase Ste14
MHTRETESRGVGSAAKVVAERASSIVRLELELAALELKRKIKALGFGVAFALAAALFLIFLLGFAFATVAAALATTMSTWLALLITTGILLTLTAVLGVLAFTRIKKGTPPVPEQAIREAKLTTEALRSDGSR